jgi:hypothetical protein
MRFFLPLITVAGLALPLFAQIGPVPAEANLRLRTSFDLTVNAPYAQTAPLFGPEGERAWAGKHWDPKFIYPQPAHDEEGAVFTVSHGPYNAVWVNTIFDFEGRRFQYVYFLPDLMVTVIDVHFNPISAKSTAVHVDYTRTAITPEGNQHVRAMSESDKTAGKEWQQAIEEALTRGKLATHP